MNVANECYASHTALPTPERRPTDGIGRGPFTVARFARAAVAWVVRVNLSSSAIGDGGGRAGSRANRSSGRELSFVDVEQATWLAA